MKTKEASRELAERMVAIGKAAGKRMRALITDMDRPLGYAIGNSLEVVEAINTLKGNGPKDLTELSIALASHMLVISDRGSYDECEANVRRVIENGEALMTFANMVEAQGGNKEWILNPDLFPTARYSKEVKADKDGYIVGVNTEGYGTASLLLGAGRNTMADKIDFAAGIKLVKKTGDEVKSGDTIAILFSDDEKRMASAEKCFKESTHIGDEKPNDVPLILDIVE
jgi:pyrimidine-nucleoside phosphorylase